MASSELTDVIVVNLSGHFDVQKLVTCNLLKLGRFVSTVLRTRSTSAAS